jgi:eukaryotic-like serine/threonine-protein kinase
MSAKDPGWPRLFELFERVADAPAAKRADLLAEIGREDPALRARIERLLALDASPDDLAADVSDWRERLADAAEPAPGRLGPWRIGRELGAGGMGRVFLAERDDGEYDQTVALKIVRGEFASDAALARFVAERRILARLDHPGIAGLVDGGVDERGRPWFAMRYVDGAPLPEWCEKHRTGLEARLGLIVEICDAAAYAHRQLVVHCDLKPSNVLVDAAGRPHLLDFGIARLIEGPNDGGTRQATQTQLRALTPGYASPEQLAGQPVGIATDVYAIGAMLHELLTGRRPYAGQDETPTAAAVAQTHGEPPPPSKAAGPNAPFAPARLRGDIDTIVATALRHDVAARYPDAAALADDLRAYLSGRPLRAQRTRSLHRARKFVARHRIAVPAAALAVVALIASTGFALFQAQSAKSQAHRAEVVRNFLLDLFDEADPDHGKGPSLSAQDLVDAGARRADVGLAGDPDTRIELLGVVGRLYVTLGQYTQSAEVRARRLDLAERSYGVRDPRVAEARIELADSEGDLDHSDRARGLIVQALDTLPPTDDARRTLRAHALGALGRLERHVGHLDEAARRQRERIALLRTVRSTPPDQLARALDDLADVEVRGAHYAQAEADAREGLAMLEHDPDTRPSELIDARDELAKALEESGKLGDAEALRRQNVALAERDFGEHTMTALQVYALAEVLRLSGRPGESLPLFQRALRIYEKTLGPNHTWVASTLISMAQAQTRTGDAASAIASLERAYRIDRETLGDQHLNTVIAEDALGQARLAAGDATGAERDFRDALAHYTGPLAGHIYAESARNGLGQALTAQGRFADAEPLLRQAHDTLEHAFGPADFRVEATAIDLAKCLAGEGRREEAETLLTTTRQAIEKGAGKSTSVTKQLDRLQAAETALRASGKGAP